MKKELEDTGLFRVSITQHLPGLVGTSPTSSLSSAGIRQSFWITTLQLADLRAQLEQFVNKGGGLIVVHGADNAFPGWQAFNRMTGVGGWRGRTEKSGPLWYLKEGKLVSDDSPGPAGSHGARLPYQVVTRTAPTPDYEGVATRVDARLR